MKIMKNVKVIGFGLLVMGMLLVDMPAKAQTMEWQSTSTMQTSGSVYSSQVTGVGAATVDEMATTTYSPANGPRRGKMDATPGTPTTPGQGDPNAQFPLGDALIPLMLCACAYLIVRATRRRTLNR